MVYNSQEMHIFLEICEELNEILLSKLEFTKTEIYLSKKDLLVMIGADTVKHQLNKPASMYYIFLPLVPHDTVFLPKKFTPFLIHNPHLT